MNEHLTFVRAGPLLLQAYLFLHLALNQRSNIINPVTICSNLLIFSIRILEQKFICLSNTITVLKIVNKPSYED